ncbi:hypothetical protein B7O34_10860 [Corynebacterium striatum]|nr:hypothetical protein [Corynebacterium striatum]HAT6525776.1 hypothetical protein [Corynebacterium striatum]HAT6563908.1 hypothetical protein [Corynebacterium striatum]HAT6569260.1 hypothetical protein [Corynebacterium striatum]
MTKTLADMTPEEREQCRGMWCEDEDGFLFVYRGDHIGRDWLAVCAYPEDVHESYLPLDYLTLRPDLPRAWAPNGKPAAGEWEYAVQYLTPDGWKYSRESWDNRWQESEAVQEVRAHRDHPDEETRLVRRLVSESEVMEE